VKTNVQAPFKYGRSCTPGTILDANASAIGYIPNGSIEPSADSAGSASLNIGINIGTTLLRGTWNAFVFPGIQFWRSTELICLLNSFMATVVLIRSGQSPNEIGCPTWLCITGRNEKPTFCHTS